MELAGFCRNCLSRWYREEAAEQGTRWRTRRPGDRLRNAVSRVEVPIPDRTPDPAQDRAGPARPAALLIAACGRSRAVRAGLRRGRRAEGGGAHARRARARAASSSGTRTAARAPRTRRPGRQLTGAGAQPEGARPARRRPEPRRAERRRGPGRAARGPCGAHGLPPAPDSTAFLRTGRRARVLPDGTAVAPAGAPDVVKRVILAGNEIAKFPYKWGGGHGAWRDDGYDCSGSVSFALAGAGLLKSPLTSGGFLNYGASGPGRLDHDLHPPGPHLHDRGRPALRHERPGPRRYPLAGGTALDRRLLGAAHPRAVADEPVAYR